jgi:hypothetical protein
MHPLILRDAITWVENDFIARVQTSEYLRLNATRAAGLDGHERGAAILHLVYT